MAKVKGKCPQCNKDNVELTNVHNDVAVFKKVCWECFYKTHTKRKGD